VRFEGSAQISPSATSVASSDHRRGDRRHCCKNTVLKPRESLTKKAHESCLVAAMTKPRTVEFAIDSLVSVP
jgi:hypothetical protein